MAEDLPTPHPKVFISYSHDSAPHRAAVAGLAQRLRADGFETMIDQYVEGTPPQGWPRWMLNQIDWADFILIVCTATYDQRFRGHAPADVGRGVDWEGAIIANELYILKSVSTRFVPVFFGSPHIAHIPEPIVGATFYGLTSETDYTALTNFLAGAAGIPPHPLGPTPIRAKETVAPLQFPADIAGTVPDLSDQPAPGGTMAIDDTHYVGRAADRSAQAAAGRRCETIVIRAPRQFGKSSLLARYLALCRQRGKAVASVDFSMFEESIAADYGQFLSTLAGELARRLRQPPPPGELRAQHDFHHFIESQLLPPLAGPVVFAFDETDRILRQPHAADFFSMVRMWHNERADPASAWHKVGLALVSSTEPKLFIRDPLRSPFNVGLRLLLEPFTAAETAALNARYGAPLADGECAELHRLLGGHPFLTQEAYYELFGPSGMPFERLCRKAAQHDGPFGEHLRAMLANLHLADGLLPALQQVIASEKAPRDDDFHRLQGAGLVRPEDGRVVPANQIYADFFRSAG